MSNRCNGCALARLKRELGDKFLALPATFGLGGVEVYELDAEPVPRQGLPVEHDGRPIRFHAWFMSTGHSDSCMRGVMEAVRRYKEGT